MIVSHEHGFVFMKTRKTAGTSVEIALSRVCGDDDVITPVTDDDEVLRRAHGGRGPQHYESPPNLERKAFNHMPVSMVRKMLGRRKFEAYLSFAIERNPWDAVVSLYHWRNRDAQPGSSLPFGEYAASEAVAAFATKNQRIYRIKGEVAVDRVLRYESLDTELAGVWTELGLPGTPDLPHAKAGTRPRGPSYRSYYDDESRKRVADLFAAPIAELGYEF